MVHGNWWATRRTDLAGLLFLDVCYCLWLLQGMIDSSTSSADGLRIVELNE